MILKLIQNRQFKGLCGISPVYDLDRVRLYCRVNENYGRSVVKRNYWGNKGK